jgi:mannose-6-phosphate isomerase-like protein (cupin superfamily)
MDPRFDDIFTDQANEIFRIVFFPDRIYHARHLSATRSSRYRYNVTEVRGSTGITVMKGDVYLGGARLCGMLRLEYDASRLVEQAREINRRLGPRVKAWVKAVTADPATTGETTVTLYWDPLIGAYACELWETLEPPPGSTHDHRVLAIMGRDAPITRASEITPALGDLKGIQQVLCAFREDDTLYPTQQPLGNVQWDNAFLRSHQVPNDPTPNSGANTVEDDNYALYFQRGWFVQNALDVQPVRYENPLMDGDNPERHPGNIVEMRWLFQRELGSEVVFFHHVTVDPGSLEGTHRHIGSEELYYITEGEGTAWMEDGDDPSLSQYPLEERHIYGLDPVMCRRMPVKPGSIIYTKSGGVHGIRNDSTTDPLRFVAFLYHTS